MKKSLLLAFMLMIAANIFAQQQIATLNHNDTISVFYGNNALKDAHNAAVAGDIVTLSSGTFIGCNISKPITLRGAGAITDTIANTFPTLISNSLYLELENVNTEHYLIIEGIFIDRIYHAKNNINAKINKCYISNYNYVAYDKNCDVEFVNCLVAQINGGNSTTSHYNFVNSAVHINGTSNSNYMFLNSLLILGTYLENVIAYNSVITRTSSNYYFGNTASAYKCIFVKNGSNNEILRNKNMNTNITFNKLDEVFETWHSCTYDNFSFDERYILKEEIATSFLGSDGTEVGIHGGMFPFDIRPSYMVVKKCNVAQKSTIDGKLSVDIEVMVEE